MVWLHGQGLPKSMDVSKSIDRKVGAHRPVVGHRKAPGYLHLKARHGVQQVFTTDFPETSDEPASAEAAAWIGWGTALKPAMEPIIVARKPPVGTVAENVLEWGVGGLNVDACRAIGGGSERARLPTRGRWPANVIHDGTGTVTDLLGAAAPYFYCAKASDRDRAGSRHPTVKPVNLLRYLVRLVTPPGGTVLDPFAGSGTTGQAALEEGFAPILIEREEEYVRDIERRLSLLR
jgi:site-specific DNA-methyltransferase (adenine-specific)